MELTVRYVMAIGQDGFEKRVDRGVEEDEGFIGGY